MELTPTFAANHLAKGMNMRIRILILEFLVVIASSLQAQVPTDTKIYLVMADGTRVTVEPTSVQPTKITIWNFSQTLYYGVRGVTSDCLITSSPVSIDLGTINPKKVIHPFNLVKLEAKEGKRVWVMKATSKDFFPFPESEIIPLATRPLPVKGVEGNHVLQLPTPLPDGEYALFTNVEAWEFTVKTK